MAIEGARVRKKILCAAHGSILGATGGVEVYQRLMDERLIDDYEFFYFSPDLSNPKKNTYILYQANGKIIRSVQLKSQVSQKFGKHEELEALFSDILAKEKFDLVHFHHFMRLTPSLAQVATERGVPYLVSIHDFYAICDEYNLLNDSGQYCDVFKNGGSDCDRCLQKIRKCEPGSQQIRRTMFAEVLKHASGVIFNTRGIRDDFIKFFPDLLQKPADVIGAPSATVFKKPQPRDTTGKIKILIPNGISKIKGADVLIPVMQSMDPDRFEFHVYGKIDRAYRAEEVTGNRSNVKLFGQYKLADLEAVASSIHLSLHLSIWPETYCISLSEMWDLGIVPVAADLGALGERVEQGVNGYRSQAGNVSEVISILNRLSSDRAELERVRQNLHAGLSITAEKCAESLSSIYARTIQALPVQPQWGTIPESWSLQSPGFWKRFLDKF